MARTSVTHTTGAQASASPDGHAVMRCPRNLAWQPVANVSGRLAGTMLLMLLTGCSLAPHYDRPAAPVAASFANTDAATASPDMARVEWQQFFTDPRLRQLLQLALDNNRDARIAMQRVEEARALYGIRRADQLPGISAGLSAARMHLPTGMSFSGSDLDSTQYAVTLALSSWELDFWGRVRNLKAAALEAYLGEADARRAVELSLIAQVANTYLLERDLDERIDTARQALTTRDKTWRIMQRRNEVGAISRLDASQARILRDQARAELAVLEQQRERAHNALVQLVGVALPDESVPLSAIEAGFSANIGPGISSDVLLDRPDVQAAEHRLKAANANIGVARAAFFPRITLFGGLGSSSSALDGLFGPNTRAWLFVPSLSQPLFDNGRNQASLDVAEARRNMAVADYERTIQTAFREVADANADRHWLGQQVTLQHSMLADQTERVRLAQLRYQHGMSSFLEVLEAERAQFAAEQLLVQTRRALLSVTVSLYAALGGGSPSDQPAAIFNPPARTDRQ